MFRKKILLSILAKRCKNQLQNKTETLPWVVRDISSCCSIPIQTFSSNRTPLNDIQKYLTLNNKTDFGKCRNNFSKLSDEKCWNCHEFLELKKFTCASCGALQFPKNKVNYFELFGISQTYDVDLEDLSAKFKNLQMTFHPDKFVNKSKEELDISEMYSRLVNKAYTTLKDPVARGFYILELQNIPVTSTFPLGQEFLLAIMEKNEELERINSEKILGNFSKINNKDVEKQINLVSEAFHQNKWNDAEVNLLKLKYYINLDTKIKGKQTDLSSSDKT